MNSTKSTLLTSRLACIAVSTFLFFLLVHSNYAFAIVNNGRGSSSGSMIQIKNIVYNYNNALDSNPASSTTGTILFHRISFADDTLFPQMFESTPTSTNDIIIDNGKTLPARPTTLTINKIQSNNTLVLALHSLNDKYLLTGDLKGSAKPAANSTADNAEFSLTGKININKNKSYPVVASLTETKSKEITLTITDAKAPNNFKTTLDFSPPRTPAPLAE